MKTFLAAWFGTLLLGWFALFLFGALFDSMGILLLGVTVIAGLITLIAGLYEEVDKLSCRIDQLEEKAPSQPAEGDN